MPTLNWVGKDEVLRYNPPYHTLEKKYTFNSRNDTSENMIIKGDNLLALKALLPQYENKIKCIYIDPPYNTGNENWVYNDNVNSPKIKKWLGEVVAKDDLSRHDKWLCMMLPRLKLLHRLLSDDGVIFISIDDNEMANLKLLCDEVMGGGNFVANLPTIMNLKGNNDEFGFSGTHEYTIVYAKNKNSLKLGEFDIDNDELNEWQEDDIGFFKQGANLKSTGINAPREKRPNLYFPIFIDENNKVYVTDDNLPPNIKNIETIYPITNGIEMSWRWSKDKIKNDINDIIVSRNSGISIYKKQRPTLGDMPSKKPKTLFYKPTYSSGNGTTQIKNIFGYKFFETPKPLDLIKDFLQISTDKNSIILDSFAGSGTTAHAVLELNKKDGGNRKFILVEMEDYAENITAERVKRVIKGYGKEPENSATGGDFSFYELGDRLLEENGNLNEKVSIEKIREYIYFSETKEKCEHKGSDFLGECNGVAYYFIYKKDDITTLDFEYLVNLKKASSYVIYADVCVLSNETMMKYNITFKKIPRDIKKV
ncbi:site-specific DNA-methyltransferase [Campylobacter devanensis]|uniref:site-specific DNA-methyltransferase n=1 Tax=Campylobacter devanensis TaxID=3161138 RepID=UPI000A34C061|nr:site-specific DNA-methyltransferase [Campylobacter sp. P146]